MENAVSQSGASVAPPETSIQANSLGTGTVEEKAKEFGRKLDQASGHLQDSWGDAATKVKQSLDTTGEQIKYKSQVAKERTKQKMIIAKERTAVKFKESRAELETQVQSHPLKSVAYAFGAGALLGVILGRAKR